MAKKPIELLAPAGNMEKLQAAVYYGADAVYFAGPSFGLRAFAPNFSWLQLAEAISFCHRHGVKAYITVNVYAHNQDLEGLPSYIRHLAESGADAAIVADPGVLSVVKAEAPQLPVHLSTQANTTNKLSARFWQEQGVSRVVLARELTRGEVTEIAKAVPDLELEVFVHGAMCISYSGRCLLSKFMTGRDANKGECAQVCRWNFALVEEKRPGEYYPIAQDERGTYILNSRDLCLLEYLPELVEAGVRSFKIEGRMKSVYYVATVTKIWREAIDSYLTDPDSFQVKKEWLEELGKVSHRPYTSGFWASGGGEPRPALTHLETSKYLRSYDFVGLVTGVDPGTGAFEVEARNPIDRGDRLEVVSPRGPVQEFIFPLERVNPNQTFTLSYQGLFANPPQVWSLLRRAKKS
ncbi:MAG: U32 family peptidase [Firmicutes bacterium]|nr:U32 family peptidase [Bacillota bacterium]